jgi:hypothetical protein
MRYRYMMHWYRDAEEPLSGGRGLFGQTAPDALSEAASLWAEGTYAASTGYIVIDTDDGTVICRREPQTRPADLADRFPRLSSPG